MSTLRGSERDLKEFLEALTDVRDDFTCVQCCQLCENPKTFQACCHTVCAKHLEEEDTKYCPSCGQNDVADIYVEESFSECVETLKNLDALFKSHKASKDLSIKVLDCSRYKLKATVESTAKRSHQPEAPLKGNPKENTKIASKSLKNPPKNLEKRNMKGETALHVACRLCKMDKIRELLEFGANPNTKDNAGWTPLHEVVQKGRLDIVELLLQHKALPDVPGLDNETALHEAIRYKYYDIAEILVRYGANVTARNIKGETPISLCDSPLKQKLLKCQEQIILSQTQNINDITANQIDTEYSEIVAYAALNSKADITHLHKLAEAHENLSVELKFNKYVTHLIVETVKNRVCMSTVDVLQSIVDGKWIVSSDWLHDSTEVDLKPIHEYEVCGILTPNFNGPKKARMNRYRQNPGLFDGCHFYFANFPPKFEISKSLVLTKAVLSKLVTDAGGKVLRREPNPELIPDDEKTVPYHAGGGPLKKCSHFIIYALTFQPMYNMEHLKALPIGWLIECIEKYELCDPC